MRELSPSELLEIWENGTAQTADQKALALLCAAFPEESAAALAHRSIGQINALLLDLREKIFGSRFVSVAMCPQCGERLELNFETPDIRAAPNAEFAETLTLNAAGYEVHFRLPNSADLADVRCREREGAAEGMLLDRCLLSVRHGEKETSVEALPTAVVDAIVERMAQADPQANIELALTCPACDHRWQAIFDLLTYLWHELDAWAHRILRETHDIASAYGWHERDILNMRPLRRQIYMEMIGR